MGDSHKGVMLKLGIFIVVIVLVGVGIGYNLMMSSLGTTESQVTYSESQGKSMSETSPSEKAEELALQAFRQTHTEQIIQIYARKVDYFHEYDAERDATTGYPSNSSYRVIISYEKILTYPEGTMFVRYRTDYWVEVESEKVAVDFSIGKVVEPLDFSIGKVHRFEGVKPITSKSQAVETFFMLVDRSPSKDFWIYYVEEDNGLPLSLEVLEMDGYYNVTGTFRNWAVNCAGAKIVISYNIFKNGTATLESVKTICPPLDGVKMYFSYLYSFLF